MRTRKMDSENLGHFFCVVAIVLKVLQGSVVISLVSLERVSTLNSINSWVFRNLTSQESKNDPAVVMSFENKVCWPTILQVAPRWADSESDR